MHWFAATTTRALLSKRFVRIDKLFRRNLKVLGIESTCDDTGASVVDDTGRVLSDIKSSQIKDHVEFGGVVPIYARFKHLDYLYPVVSKALSEAGCTIQDIDAVAVANRPGLELSLEAGVTYAKDICLKYDKPLIPVHHMEAHALMPTISAPQLRYPYLCLLISGGHSLLCIVKSISQFYLLGSVECNPIGETLDKIAREMKIKNLGLPYSQLCGGRAIEILADLGNLDRYKSAAKGQISSQIVNCDFKFGAFRGITSYIMRRTMKEVADLPPDCPFPYSADLARFLLWIMSEHIAHRVNRALDLLTSTDLLERIRTDSDLEKPLFHDYTKDYDDFQIQLAISGGVACNMYIVRYLRKYFDLVAEQSERQPMEIFTPEPINLCTDNGVMIAWNGMLTLLDEAKNGAPAGRILRTKQELMSAEHFIVADLGHNLRPIIADGKLSCKIKNVDNHLELEYRKQAAVGT